MILLAKVENVPIWGIRFSYRQGAIEEQGVLLSLPGGEIRAYKNECRHLPMRLDAREPHDIWNESADLLRCCSHGALFRPNDGLCFSGPCQDEHLEQLPIEIRDGKVYLGLEA